MRCLVILVAMVYPSSCHKERRAKAKMFFTMPLPKDKSPQTCRLLQRASSNPTGRKRTKHTGKPLRSASPEPIRLIQVPLSQTVQAGAQSVAILACNAKAFPSPHYAWFRAYAEVDPVGGEAREVKLEEVEGAVDR